MTELESLKLYLSSPESAPKPSDEVIRSLAARCEWFAPVRILLEASSGEPDAVLSVTAPWREESSLRLRGIDVGALVRLTSEEVIDRSCARKTCVSWLTNMRPKRRSARSPIWTRRTRLSARSWPKSIFPRVFGIKRQRFIAN